jgi:hypothetical protein
MEKSSSTLTQPPRRKPFKVSILFAPIFVPLLFLAAAISIPWTYIHKLKQRRQERKFVEQMKKASRHMSWEEFKQAIGNGEGTAIGEHLSIKGPFRVWWTPEDVPATSPHKWKPEQEQNGAWMEPEFRPFSEWCYARFTNPQSGRAWLVPISEKQRKQLRAMLTNARFVSTCAFRSVREKDTVKVRL